VLKHLANRGHTTNMFLSTTAFCLLYLILQSEEFMYLFVRLFVRSFALSSVLLMNRLTQARKIGNNYTVNFSWSSEHIFNFLRFVIQKLRVF